MSDASENLLQHAMRGREHAYARYSGFRVGAALLSEDGEIFLGGNIENVSLGLTMCAERVAVGTAVQSGKSSFREVAIVADSTDPIVPCGACRQVLAEFNPHLKIVSRTLSGRTEEFSLDVLLPASRQGILQ
ncbi:MAG: cytidine deaminase [Chthoniobacterales bacterium]